MTARSFSSRARDLTAIGRRFYDRGWALGTSGNFSAVVNRRPLRLAITASAVHKGTLRGTHILEVDGRGHVVGRGTGTPSAETAIHVEIVRRLGAGAVLHTHSIWSTILSGASAHPDGIALEGFEMLKGLEGVRTHEHREWIPIVENDQDIRRLALAIGDTLKRHPQAHALLLRRHGLYTWGATLADAERHVEILEFLFEAVGRAATWHANTEKMNHGALESS